MPKQRPSAVKADNVSKSFRLPHEKHTTLKQTVLNLGKRSFSTQTVLDDISLEVKKGEFFGIVGRNGSGKSTLLKILAGIYQPDSGGMHLNGNLTPFIELGVGFSPELSGRDNVYLNGTILGLSPEEIDAKYDEIVGFAELEDFMDQKLKNYSSGMQVRLAFSIAIQAHNDILLIDEVLAVGDENFQNKCVDYFSQIRKNKDQTVVLVTHDMGWVERFCDKAIVIHDGEIVEGVQKPYDAHKLYSRINQAYTSGTAAEEDQNRWGDGRAVIQSIDMRGENQQDDRLLQTGYPVDIDIHFESKTITSGTILVGLAVYDETGTFLYGPNSYDEALSSDLSRATYRIPELRLNTGRYFLSVGLFNQDATQTYDFMDKAIEFKVVNEHSDNNRGKVVVDGEWRY